MYFAFTRNIIIILIFKKIFLESITMFSMEFASIRITFNFNNSVQLFISRILFILYTYIHYKNVSICTHEHTQ